MPEQQVRTARSFCRICTSLCGILVDTVDEQVVRVRGDRDHPMSQGYTCVKGRALPAMHHHPQRIERPLMRAGGSLQPAAPSPTSPTPHGHEHANVNVLTSHQQADPLTGMARYSGVPVSVHPAVAT